MRLTTKGRFAVTAMIDLALRQHNGPVSDWVDRARRAARVAGRPAVTASENASQIKRWRLFG